MKKLLLIGLLAIPLSTHPWAKGGFMPYVVTDPQDLQGEAHYVKLASQGGLCGAVFLKSQAVGKKVAVKAVQVTYPFGRENRRETRQDGAYTEIPVFGKWQRYDWAGIHPRDHYRIYCYEQDPRNPQAGYYPVDCEKVLVVPDKQNNRLEFRHNRGCIAGIGGPDAPYDPLYMDKAG